MTETPTRIGASLPDGVDAAEHQAQLVKNLDDALDAKSEKNSQELEDMADGH
ncbi:hypothetical protein BH11ACT5_BH11ACT5_22280 [soil metagenome]